jgi:hypothetical protein
MCVGLRLCGITIVFGMKRSIFQFMRFLVEYLSFKDFLNEVYNFHIIFALLLNFYINSFFILIKAKPGYFYGNKCKRRFKHRRIVG